MAEEKIKKESGSSTASRWLLRVILALLIIIFSLPLLVHFGPVQHFIINRISNNISEKTGSEVTIERVDFSVFKGLKLNEVYISNPGHPGDTLLSLQEISSSLRENLSSLLKNRLDLNAINITGLDLRVHKARGDSLSNIEKFLRAFDSGSQDSLPPYRLNVNLKSVNLDLLKMKHYDENTGNRIMVQLDKGLIDFNNFSSLSDSIRLSKLMLSNPVVRIEKDSMGIHRESDITQPSDTLPETENILPFYVFVDHLELSGGQFSYDDWNFPGRLNDTTSIDFKHMAVVNLNVNADSTSLDFPLELKSNIKALTLTEKSGFEIQQLDVKELNFNSQLLSLREFVLKTNDSYLNDHLVFKYNDIEDFKNFTDSVYMDAELMESQLAMKDLHYFFRDLINSGFYNLNKNRRLFISGKVHGTIDDLRAEDLELAIDQLIRLEGTLSTRDLTHSKSALINLSVERLSTSLYGLGRIIPGFSPPSQFYKLDPISFRGDIDGFFNDFVIYGTLQSDLGKVVLDTRLDLKKGRDNALYSGDIALQEFDLGKWTGNEDFGLTTLTARITNGKGLTLDKVFADLNAQLEKFEFRNYSYSDIVLEGEFQKNRFDGNIEATDENLNLSFDGQLDFSNNRIRTNFKADIRNINLKALNLSKDISSVNGSFESTLRGSDVKNFEGFVDVGGLSLIYKDKNFVFDSLYVSSAPGRGKTRNVIVSSDILNASMDGVFNLTELWPSLQSFMHAHHPTWAARLKLPRPEAEHKNPQDFRFKINVSDTKDYLELVNLPGLRLQGLDIEGSSNLQSETFDSYIKVRRVNYKEYEINNINAGLLHNEQMAKYNILIHSIANSRRTFNPVELNMDIEEDIVSLNLKTRNILDSIGNIDLVVNIIPDRDKLRMHVYDNALQMFSTQWSFDEHNEVILGEDYIEINNFFVNDETRSIRVADYRNKGVTLSLENFDFGMINGLINYKKIDFTGPGNANVRVNNIFDKSEIYLNAEVPEFRLNNVDYGVLGISASLDTFSVARVDMKLERPRDDLFLNLSADYKLDTREVTGDVTARNFSMEIFEFIIDEGISSTAGTANIDVAISGTADEIELEGEGRIYNGTTTVDYLGAQLYIGNERILISEDYIDLTNVNLYDIYGNRALMQGGLRHDLLADFSSSLNMRSDRFLALNTTKQDNPMYYGKGIGEISVDFNGPFQYMDIDVTAITGPGTVLNIPVEDSYGNFDESFITFVNREQILNPKEDTVILVPKIEGVDVEINLSITRDAYVNIIFNERLNDVIKGRGNGDLRIIVTREGDFNIFGGYEVESGEYLFTAWGIVAKPFTVRRGGQITWTGDPVNANLNIEAEYSGLRVPVNVFLAEYLISSAPSVQSEAKKRTAVDLTMRLRGTLYNPVVNFDLSFPELQGELRTFADNKVRTLRENEADLNEQVAGLIMFRSFLPSNSLGDNLLTSESLTQTGYNTLSEFVSNQLSYLLSGFLQEALAENGFVSGIDFEIGFSRNADINEEGNLEVDQLIPDEIEVHFKPRFQDDKWGFDYGTSFVNSSTFTNYIIHDFVLEYYLTEDRRLKLRAYGKWDKDEVEFGNEQRYGVGINFRKEFGSITEFQKALNEDIGNLKKNSEDNPQ